MSKYVLVISASPRQGGNSDRLADEFVRGAHRAGNRVEKISLRGKNIAFCKGCLVCQTTQRCVMQDDADAISRKMLSADAVAFATPVYYYGMCGQMKTLLDRCNPLFSADYRFRDIYLLASAAENEKHTADGTITGLQGWVDCFEKARLAGTVFCGGVTAVGDIDGRAELHRAFEMGKSV